MLSVWASRIQSNLTGSSRRRRNHVFLIFFPNLARIGCCDWEEAGIRTWNGGGDASWTPSRFLSPSTPSPLVPIHLHRKNSASAVLWCYGFAVYVLSVAGVNSLWCHTCPESKLSNIPNLLRLHTPFIEFNNASNCTLTKGILLCSGQVWSISWLSPGSGCCAARVHTVSVSWCSTSVSARRSFSLCSPSGAEPLSI